MGIWVVFQSNILVAITNSKKAHLLTEGNCLRADDITDIRCKCVDQSTMTIRLKIKYLPCWSIESDRFRLIKTSTGTD